MQTSCSFGKIEDFIAGDLVEWSDLGETIVGLLISLENKEIGGRNVAIGKVQIMKTPETIEIPCITLKKHIKPSSKTI